jgi:AraC-like DNA-binding protein
VATAAQPDFRVAYRTYAPPWPLRSFVELIWYWRGYPTPGARERLLPAASTELVVDLTSSSSAVAGPSSESFFIERTAQDELIGVHFAPGGAFPFAAFPLDDLHNRSIGLVDFCGEPDATRLVDSLHRAATIDAKIQALERWLRSVQRRSLQHPPAVAFAMKELASNPRLASTAAVATKTGFSQRHLIQLFRTHVGLTPKRYSRLARFNRIIHRIAKLDDPDWADLALEWGYFDQSHFNHDFRTFSGLTPSQYMDLRIADQTGHVRAPD